MERRVHYRDTVVWNKAMELAEHSCKAAAALPVEERFALRNQISRAAISVPSNIAEGWTRESMKEKSQFLAIAHGSLAELHTQLLLGDRLGWMQRGTLSRAYVLIDEVSRMLTVLRRRTRARR